MIELLFLLRCELCLFSLERDILDHLKTSLERYGSLEMPPGSLLERIAVHMEGMYCKTSKRHTINMAERVDMMNGVLD